MERESIEGVGRRLRRKAYEVLRRSVYLLHVDSGSCNGCDIEVIDALTPYFDTERFGIKLVASPKHADVILVTGPVTRQFVRFLKRTYKYVPKPCVVIACGSCASGGGVWYDTYNVLGGVDKVIPVDTYIPGCPPRPSAILHGVLVALGVLESRMKGVKYIAETKEFKPKKVPTEGLLRTYMEYRSLLIFFKKMLGYRLAYRLFSDYMDALREAKNFDELRALTYKISKDWGDDPRIREVLEKANEVVEKIAKRE